MKGRGCILMPKGDSVSLTLYGTLYLIVSKPTQMIDISVNKYIRHASNRAAIRVISSITAVTQQKQLFIITFTANLAKLKAKRNAFVKSQCATFYIHREIKLNNAWMLPKVNILPPKKYKGVSCPHISQFFKTRKRQKSSCHTLGGFQENSLSPNQVSSHKILDTRQAFYPLSYGKIQTEQGHRSAAYFMVQFDFITLNVYMP